MTYRGHIKNGAVVLDETVRLPEGTTVEVAVVQFRDMNESDNEVPTLYERLADVIGIADGLPSDLASKHDYYAHGRPNP